MFNVKRWSGKRTEEPGVDVEIPAIVVRDQTSITSVYTPGTGWVRPMLTLLSAQLPLPLNSYRERS